MQQSLLDIIQKTNQALYSILSATNKAVLDQRGQPVSYYHHQLSKLSSGLLEVQDYFSMLISTVQDQNDSKKKSIILRRLPKDLVEKILTTSLQINCEELEQAIYTCSDFLSKPEQYFKPNGFSYQNFPPLNLVEQILDNYLKLKRQIGIKHKPSYI